MAGLEGGLQPAGITFAISQSRFLVVAFPDEENDQMDKEIAQTLIALAVSTDRIIGEMFNEVEKITDEALREQIKKGVGDVLCSITIDLIFPLVDRYPDLNPDK